MLYVWCLLYGLYVLVFLVCFNTFGMSGSFDMSVIFLVCVNMFGMCGIPDVLCFLCMSGMCGIFLLCLVCLV